ncbi:MAG: peptidoglycan-binding protein LysM [Deltaproteobacteria bacterium]|uniref:Peptidoglycan-binding protein LysM n=1 Tax=Candidatus Zymogenus saltonus TaxID=2844893 RepID=A0A9D8KDP5_9DELT|nr:peptidoglycan-binding protein LysM [Candidatus Zymogenus saltonus]
MGLFKFIKTAGEAIFKKGDKKEENIEKHIKERMGGQVKSIEAKVEDGVVTLTGVCDSQDTIEKVILLAGNIEGVESVNGDGLKVESGKAGDESEFYTIVKGDSLWKIAKKYYGDGNKYPVLFEANREVIKNPDLIYPGQVIRVPALK